MRQDIVNALDYFRRKTFATAVFIRIQEGFAYSIEVESKVRYDFIPIFELDEFIERLGVCHQIQIISQCDKWGNYVLLDVELLEFEKEIDY